MDKDSQQMKNSVRAELGRNQEGRTRWKLVMYQERECVMSLLKPCSHETEQGDLIMKNVGDKDDPENRLNWRAEVILVWNPVASMPKGDSCRLLYIFSAEKTDRLRVQSFRYSPV